MSGELLIESVDYPTNCHDESIKLNFPTVEFDIFRKYCEGEVRLEINLVRMQSSEADDFYSGNFIFSVERVAVQPLATHDLPARGFRSSECELLDERHHADNPQPPMSVVSSQVMDIFKGVLKPTIRVVNRFISRARLYRFQPVYEILREWESVETILIVLDLPLGRKGELQTSEAFCIGGRLGSLLVGDCIPYQAIESRSKLVSELSESEGKLVGSDSCDGSSTELEPHDPPPGTFIITDYGSRSFSLKQGVEFMLEGLPVKARSLKPAPTVFEAKSR